MRSFQIDNLVLLYNIKFDEKYNIKLFFKYLDLFKIKEINKIKNFYIFEKIDKILLKSTYFDNRLKRYIERKKNFQVFAKLNNKIEKIERNKKKKTKIMLSNLSNN